MIENDTLRLLRECDAGVRMGIRAIGDCLAHTKGPALRHILQQAKAGHEELERQTRTLLSEYGDQGKEPGMLAEGMSKLKTEMKTAMKPSDSTVADLITDGVNMGVKSLSRYLNQYKAAGEDAKDITKRLIHLESNLGVELRSYL